MSLLERRYVRTVQGVPNKRYFFEKLILETENLHPNANLLRQKCTVPVSRTSFSKKSTFYLEHPVKKASVNNRLLDIIL